MERACRDGILSTASLMVAGPEAADAVHRARALPSLKVGLHLVLVDGPACLPARQIPDLVGADGQFPGHQARLGVRYFFNQRARRQLHAEIRAQFAAFAATGLALDHANAHKHMHLHPTVGRMMIDVGRDFGLHAVRIPSEPASVLETCGTQVGLGARIMERGTVVLRRQARRAGLRTNDHVFGIAWSGHMTADRIIALAVQLPAGLSEIYFHPATSTDATLARTMPDYQHAAELHTLIDPAVRDAFERAGVAFTGYRS